MRIFIFLFARLYGLLRACVREWFHLFHPILLEGARTRVPVCNLKKEMKTHLVHMAKVDTAIKSRYHQAKVGEDGFRILNS